MPLYYYSKKYAMLELNQLEIGKGRFLYRTGQISLEPGKLYVLFGANGAGKSSLLDAIALGEFKSGNVLLDGVSLKDLPAVERARIIALVESRFFGNDYLSVADYLELGRFPHTGFLGSISETDAAIIQKIAEKLGVQHLLSQSTETLSDGERQRVSIARALIQETSLLLLDEPTSYLDYPNKRATLQLLKEIAQNEQKIVLLVSHDLELCLEYGDCFLLINPVKRELEVRNKCLLEDVLNLAFPHHSV